jgi:hypothetical protein
MDYAEAVAMKRGIKGGIGQGIHNALGDEALGVTERGAA